MPETAKLFKELTQAQREAGESRTMFVPPPAIGAARGSFPSRVRRWTRFWLRVPLHRLYVAVGGAVATAGIVLIVVT